MNARNAIEDECKQYLSLSSGSWVAPGIACMIGSKNSSLSTKALRMERGGAWLQIVRHERVWGSEVLYHE